MRSKARESECVHGCMWVRYTPPSETARLALAFFFFPPESERTRAKGVVAKEAWGDYKDLGL